MSSFSKFWLGLFTFLPLVLTIALVSFFFAFILENAMLTEHSYNWMNSNYDEAQFVYSMFWFIVIIIILGMVSLGVRIYYVVHTNNLPGNDNGKKIMWTLILIFVGLIGSIVYYFIEILPLKNTKEKS